jgi:hypothetical protein
MNRRAKALEATAGRLVEAHRLRDEITVLIEIRALKEILESKEDKA